MNPENQPHGRLRGAAPYIVATLLGVVIAYLVVVLYIFPVDPDTATPEVPSVVGVSFEEAEKTLTDAGFVAVRGEIRAGSAKGDTVARVLEQVPSAGTRQQVGSKVTLHTGGALSSPRSPAPSAKGTE